MVWKLREGKVPPKEWMADLLTYLERAHGVAPTRDVVEKLYAIVVEQWREGATAREVGKATCSCQKGQIVPSPAALVQLKRGELKPPRGAKRGDLFGFEELRARKDQEKAGAVSAARSTAAPLPRKPKLPALPARKLRTSKKGSVVKAQTETVPSSAAATSKTAEPSPVTPPAKPDAARLKATEAKLRSLAEDLGGDDL